MRRKIELWINGIQADLNEQAHVLFNYAYTDITDPAAVKNSYSQQITLPGSPVNGDIFGHLARPDRRTEAGFNPLIRTPFAIYSDTGEILKSGYLKLDQVITRRGIVQGYKVSLYGGLGSFLYALSYDGNGDKLTLADLDYLDGGDGELDFNITAAAITAAWARLTGSTPSVYDSIWDVINFAPAYNGVPDGDFSPDKGWAYYYNIGVDGSQVDGDTTYTHNGSRVIVNLAEKHTEWDVHDLRCYLQRPVLSMRAFLAAVDNWASSNGFSFDYSDIPVEQYRTLWKTLPMLPSLGSFKQTSGDLSFFYSEETYTDTGDILLDNAAISGVQSSMEIKARLNSAMLAFECGSTHANPGYLRTRFRQGSQANEYGYHTLVFVQLLGYNGTTLLAGSTIQAYTSSELAGLYPTAEALADLVGFTPEKAADFEGSTRVVDSVFLASGDSYFNFFYLRGTPQVSGVAIDRIRLAVKTYRVAGVYKYRSPYQGGGFEPFSFLSAEDTGMLPYFYTSQTSLSPVRAEGAAWINPSASGSYTSSSNLRSGALIEKAKLLSSKYTPADYLLSLCRQFGWSCIYDEVAKKLTLLTRNSFFNTGEEAIDLTDRVDTSRDITITPCYAGARIYEFAPEVAEGHFAQEYKNTYGVDYGIQRVDTGYQFDGSPANLLEKSAFRAAATILEHGPYWNTMRVDNARRPSVFIDKGNTYTLWSAEGSGKSFDIPTLPSTTAIEYLNEYHEGYDNEYAWKLDLHEADGKGIDGEDILVYYSGYDNYDGFQVSDDDAAGTALNDNKPLWDLNPYAGSIQIANFHRYQTDTEWGVDASLDFGTPREVDIPVINFRDDSPGYIRAWAAFIRDRYNKDTKIMLCRVDLRGLQVSQDLLRRFFYYEGSYWVLNKITNYSLTTWDPVECEFIQVQDRDNYTDGQILD